MTRLAIIAVTFIAASMTAADVKPLDPNSSEPLRDQITRLVKGSTTGPTTRETLMAEVDAKLVAIDREVSRLHALGEAGKQRADDLQRRLQVLRNRRDNNAIVNDGELELHVVNVRSQETSANPDLPPAQRRRQFKVARVPVVVEVQPTGHPIILAVCSYGPTKWDVRIAKDANVKRILVGGYEIQQITGVPKDVPVEIHTYEGNPRSKNYFYAFGPNSDREDGTAKLRKLTELDPSTLQVVERYEGESIIVGPGSDEWVAQRLLIDLRPVHEEAVAYSLAQQREAVQNMRFNAVRVPPPAPRAAAQAAPPGVRIRVQVRPPGRSAFTMAEFTPAGPIEGTDFPLPERINHVTVDPHDSAVYAIDNHEVYRIEAQTRRPARLELNDPDLPRISWCNGLAFDTKRRRLVLSASNMLYAYDPAAGTWSGIVNLEHVSAMSFAYSVAHDCFYAVLMDFGGHGGATRLVRYTADGDADQLIELPRSLMDGGYRPDGLPQLIAVGEQLALIPPSRYEPHAAPRAAPTQPQPRMKCFLIDPRTGQVTYGGAMHPQPGPGQELSDAEVEEAWQGLSAKDAAEVEGAMARLASGRDRIVTFLHGELKPPAPPDPLLVQGWIDELGHEQFERRDAAMRALRRLGGQVEPALRDALAKGVSAEATARLESLLHDLEPDAEGNRKPNREELAIRLLGRIGSPAAIDLLGELAAEPAGSLRADEARRALREFARED